MTLFYTWNTFKIKFVLFYMLLYKPWKGIYTFNKFLAKCGERECLFIKCFCCTVLNWCKSSLKFILWTCSRNGKSCAPWVSLKWKNGKEKKNSIKSIMHHKSYNPKRKENLYTDQVACPGRAYSGFCSMKQQEVFPSPLYGMLAHCRLLPPTLISILSGFAYSSPVAI